MRPGQNKRSRGRNGGGGGGGGGGGMHHGGGNRPRLPHRVQTFDSNGPNVKIRGNAYQVFERYLALAREAQSSGDRVAAENFFQHAEHYFRVMNADGFNPNQNQNQNRPQPNAGDPESADGGEGEQPEEATVQIQVAPPPPPSPAEDDHLPAFLTGRSE